MKLISRLIRIGSIVLLAPTSIAGQTKGVDPSHQTTPTLTGGTSTGLFQTYSARTLPIGQYNIGVFWHRFDRDPGDLDINRIPLSLTYGVTPTIELFLNIDSFQQVTTRQPLLLSGTAFNRQRILTGGPGADPFVAFGPAQPRAGDGGAAFFPGTGNRSGSILPPAGAFSRTVDGRLIVPFDAAGYYNEFPFFPFADATGPHLSSNGLGNVTLGLKTALTDLDDRFSIGAAALIKFPSARNYDALADGRGAGVVDGGPVLIFSQQALNHRFRAHQNIGYIFTGSVERSGIKILDRRDELLLNAGVEIAPWDQVVTIAELNSVVYVGGGTPNLNPVNPLDLRLGARFFLFDGRFQLGGAWQRFLTNANTKRIFTIDPATQARDAIAIEPDDPNGFVFHIGYGKRPQRLPPLPPNLPPTVNLEAAKTTVTDGEIVELTTRATDPDNDILLYTWSATTGGIIGSGTRVRLNTTGVNPTPGNPPVSLTVRVTVDDGRGGADTASVTLTVNSPQPEPPPPNRPPTIASLSYRLIGPPQIEGQITDGESVQLEAAVSDPDGDQLAYRWNTTAGNLTVMPTQARLDTTNVTAGPGAPPVRIIVMLEVEDGHGGRDSRSVSFSVYALKKPEPERIEPDLLFRPGSARVDNVHKAVLDDLVLRLQQDPSTTLVVDGHQDAGERRSLSQRRADNIRQYLVREKGIGSDRLVVRDFGSDRPHPSRKRELDRRVELWVVPSGAETPR